MRLSITNFSFWVLLMASLLTLSCNQEKRKTRKEIRDSIRKENQKKWNEAIPGSFTEQSNLVFDSIHISQFLKKYPLLTPYQDSINKFYQHRNYSYAWFNKKGLIEQANNLADRMQNLVNEGLNKEIPYIKELDSLMYSETSSNRQTPDIALELMLTGQYFVFAKNAWQGMDEKASRAVNWYLPRKKISYSQYLDSLINHPHENIIEEETPVYRQYNLLRNYLIKYKDLQKKTTWTNIHMDRGFKSVKPGDSAQVVAHIRKRLFLLGDFKGDTTRKKYDTELEKSVKQFQARHGLKNDGVIGLGTLAEMNIPIENRIKTIMVNMERSRWLPVGLDGEYLGVNIPEFKLHVYRSDTLLWSCNVVVGKDIHKTVVFHGEMKHIVFSPYWNVPESIVRSEILPQMEKNPNYIAEHKMQITGYRNGLPIVRQLPGNHNSLGLVKFLFPNSHNIYLHDTPSKSLFSQESRAFSHGCIRVSEPLRLAQFLLKDYPEWNEETMKKAMNRDSERWVTLKETVPVFITYFTAFVDRNNQMNFRKDIYSRDEDLAKMILQ